MKTLLVLLALCFSCDAVFGEKKFRVVAKKREALDQIVIPSAFLDEVTFEEALHFAWSRTVELDTTEIDPLQKGVLMQVRFPTGEMYPGLKNGQFPDNPKGSVINYIAEKFSLATLLVEMAKQTGYDLYTTSVGVVFCPPGSSPFPNFAAEKGKTWETLYKVVQKP